MFPIWLSLKYNKTISLCWIGGDNILDMYLEKVKLEIDGYTKNSQHLLLEAVHSAGYSSPSGNSLAATVNRLYNTVLEEFVVKS